MQSSTSELSCVSVLSARWPFPSRGMNEQRVCPRETLAAPSHAWRLAALAIVIAALARVSPFFDIIARALETAYATPGDDECEGAPRPPRTSPRARAGRSHEPVAAG